jgi:hypothetical protein
MCKVCLSSFTGRNVNNYDTEEHKGLGVCSVNYKKICPSCHLTITNGKLLISPTHLPLFKYKGNIKIRHSGLYATRNYNNKEMIGTYWGIFSEEQNINSDYVLKIKNNLYVDSKDSPCKLKYANSPVGDIIPANCRICVYHKEKNKNKKVRMRAIRNIKAGNFSFSFFVFFS